MAKRCVHKGCGKAFTDPDEECVYHSGPPEFHEGQKGWKCCRPRVLTFDEFLSIPPCTTGKHSAVDDTPAPQPAPAEASTSQIPIQAEQALPIPAPRVATQAAPRPSASPAPPPESESDDPSLEIKDGQTCRRRACNATYSAGSDRSQESCVYHPGHPLFHEGSKGWTCCKRRVLDFDEFLTIEGCQSKARHMFVGSGKKGKEEEALQTVRHDFYQTPAAVIASLYLKKIDKETSKVEFKSATSLSLDLRTSDKKRYTTEMTLYAPVHPEKSTWKIMGTKIEFNLIKADGSSWPVLRADDPLTGEIIQSGRAGRA